jgi:hypothetical protein
VRGDESSSLSEGPVADIGIGISPPALLLNPVRVEKGALRRGSFDAKSAVVDGVLVVEVT